MYGYFWRSILERSLRVSRPLKQKVVTTFQLYCDILSSATIPRPFNVNQYWITIENKW